MAGAMYTLNLEFLNFLFENIELGDRIVFYRKIKAIFDVWKDLNERKENPKAQAALSRAKELQRVG